MKLRKRVRNFKEEEHIKVEVDPLVEEFLMAEEYSRYLRLKISPQISGGFPIQSWHL